MNHFLTTSLLQLRLMKKPEVLISECNIGIQLLADKCHSQSVGGSGADVLVIHLLKIFSDEQNILIACFLHLQIIYCMNIIL